MIFVDRYRQEDGATIRPNDGWFALAARHTATALDERGSHKVTDTYKHAQVKAALERLFRSKCAYCECRPTEGSTWPVEHFRPKGRVNESASHPGYYWLAYDWENLYLSCHDCNELRSDAPIAGDMTRLPARGKLDKFPLVDESQRMMAHDDPDHGLGNEEPMLLDPNVDDPEEYLAYGPAGDVRPVGDDARARSTIDICHLDRRRLERGRRRIIARVVEAVRTLELAERAGTPPRVIAGIRALVQRFADPDQPFSGAAGYVIAHPDEFAAT